MVEHRFTLWTQPVWSLGALLGASLLASGAQVGHAFPNAQPRQGEPLGLVLVQEQPSSRTDATQRMPFVELNAALEAARVRLEELTGAAEIAALAAGLRDELEQMKQENRRLNGRLEAAEAELAAKAEAPAQRGAEDDALVQAGERAAAEVARLQAELKARQQGGEAAQSAREAAETRLQEAEAALERSKMAANGLSAELAATQRELASKTAGLAKAERERKEAQATTDALRAKTASLQQQLTAALGEVERLDTENASLEAQIAQLREAADSAADAARQNLVAVEDKIRILNDALARVVQRESPASGEAEQPAPSGSSPDAASVGAASAAAAARTTYPGAPVPPATPAQRVREEVAAVAVAGEREDAFRAEAAASDPRSSTPGRTTLAEIAADLPLGERVQVENLLSDLKAKPHSQGLLLTVPGGDLFAVDSEAIGESAYDALAKVAELISIYKDRQVLIMGHSDAMGEADYNKLLSERRAVLVKQFFVDHFAIEPWRLATAGLGKERPIASNATRAGRQANRRVEVLIMH